MRRQCAWFGCSAVATATYTFDSSACTVWLDYPFEGGARAGELCDRHARSLTPPRGWRLEDRRSVPASDSAPGDIPDDFRHKITDEVLDDSADDAPGTDAAADRAPFDSEAELRNLLDAHTPLLARAFRSSGTV